MKEITLKINETNGDDFKTAPIDVTNESGEKIGSIFIGIGSGRIFIRKYDEKTYTISPDDLWGEIFPDPEDEEKHNV